MDVVADRVVAADRRIARWRRRTVLVVVAGALLLAAGSWALTTGPAVSLARSPLTQGSIGGAPQCGSGVQSETVDDTFGGGGTILDFVAEARCEFVLSLRNVTSVPVTVLAVQTTDEDFVRPLRITGATRDLKPLSADQECYGCADEYVPFTPMTIAPGDEWEIAVQGVMRNCKAPPRGQEGSISMNTDAVDLTVRTAGLRKTVSVELEEPFAVRSDGCASTF